MNKITKQCVAAIASLAMAGTLCVAGAVVAGSSAWADTAPSVDKNVTAGTTGLDNDSQAGTYQSAPWLADAPKSGSITIYKWKDEANNSGKQEKKTPIKGAGFTITKIKSVGGTDLDLTKYDSWTKIAENVEALNNNTAANVTADNTFTALSGDTNEHGVVRFKNLPLGLYKIQETKVPTGYSAAESKPFYMALPMIQKVLEGATEKTKFNYAPFVDPKNVDISKSVKKTKITTNTVGAGDTIKYTITSDLDKVKKTAQDPALVADDFKGYSVFDLAPDNYFTAYDNTVVAEVKAGTTKLEYGADKDYTVDNSDKVAATTGKDSDVARTKIKIVFTDKGREKLATAANDSVGTAAKVTVDMKFTLAASAKLSTNSITNKAGNVPSHQDGSTPSDNISSDKPTVEFATFKIKKVSSKSGNEVLGGAKFMLFAVKDDATACTKAIDAGKTGEELNKVCKAKASTGFGEKETASETKDTKVKGETEAYSVKRGEEFYVVETSAPTGYIRNPDVHNVTVATSKSEYTLTVKNLPGPGLDGNGKNWLFQLPKTGAAGVIIFALIGLGLVGSGMFVFLKNRKKEEEQQAA